MDIVQLADAGALALVSAMATNGWSEVSRRLARMFGQGDQRREAEELQFLDASRARVLAADEDEVVREVGAELRGMLRARLIEDDRSAAQFAILLEEVRRISVAAQPTRIVQRAHADGDARIYQAGGNIGLPAE